MNEKTRRRFLQTSGAAAISLLSVGSAQADGKKVPKHGHSGSGTQKGLVGTWTTSSQPPTEEAGFTEGFSNQTIRNIVRTSVGGRDIRIRLANTYGEDPLTIDHVSVGIWDMDERAVQGRTHPVTFSGSYSTRIAAGARAYSDPVSLDVEPEQNLAVSLYVEDPTGPPTTHADNRKTTYLATGNHVDDTTNEAFDSPAAGESDVLTAWFFLDGVDVVNPETSGAVVCLGDSITDGVGSSLDTDSTYPDFLAERLNDAPSVKKSVLNAGIGGNRILHGSIGGGASALERLDRDVIAQTGVTDVILLEGINDIGYSNFPEDAETETREPTTEVTAEEIIRGTKQIIARVHAKGLNIIGGTLTPFKGATYYYEEGEEKRQTVNHWIRTSGAFDGVVDFDKVIRDPDDPQRMLPKYDSGDNIHPSDAGYQAMAEAIDLELLHRSKQQNRSHKHQSRSHQKTADT